MEKKISITIPEELDEFIKEQMKLTGWSRSGVMKTMLSYGVPKMKNLTAFLERQEEEKKNQKDLFIP